MWQEEKQMADKGWYCLNSLLSQTDSRSLPWDGRNSHAVLQNLKPFLRLSAMTFVNWIIRLQMRRSHFTVLRNPCTQLTLTVVSQKRLTVLSFNSLRPSKEVGTQESHFVTQISHPTGGQPSLNSRGRGQDFRDTFKPSAPIKLSEKHALDCFYRSATKLPPQAGPWHISPCYGATPLPESQIHSSHTYPFYLFHL